MYAAARRWYVAHRQTECWALSTKRCFVRHRQCHTPRSWCPSASYLHVGKPRIVLAGNCVRLMNGAVRCGLETSRAEPRRWVRCCTWVGWHSHPGVDWRRPCPVRPVGAGVEMRRRKGQHTKNRFRVTVTCCFG